MIKTIHPVKISGINIGTAAIFAMFGVHMIIL